jgi:hypothetical protein
MTPIPPFPQYPSRADPPEEFVAEADSFLAHFPTFRGAANVLGSEMDVAAANTALLEAYATDAATAATAAATVASGVANYKGDWSTLSGPLAIPASVAHSGRIWTLVRSVADVAAQVPGVSADWTLPYPIRRINLFSEASASLRSVSSGEMVYSSYTVLDLPSADTIAVCGTGAFAVSSSAASTTIRVSTDNGVTWVSKTMPKSAVWRVLGFPTRLYAVAEGSTGANSCAYSDDNGVTWTAASFAGTWASPMTLFGADGAIGFAALTGGTASIKLFAVTTDSGTTWTTNKETPSVPPPIYMLVASSTFFVTTSPGSPYFTSATGLVGSWTSRAYPGGTSTLSKTVGDSRLLAYYNSLSGPIATTPIYLLENPVTFSWASLNRPRFGDSVPKLVGQSTLLGASVLQGTTGVPGLCATSRIQGTDQRWVPRTAPFATAGNAVAKNSTTAIVLWDNTAYRIALGTADEPLGLWE